MDRKALSACGLIFSSILLFSCKFVRTSDVDVRSTEHLNEQSESTSHSSSVSGHQTKWISQIFLEAREQFTIVDGSTPVCERDFRLFLEHLQNQTIWSIRMLESSQWPEVGLFAGMTHHLGNFDECLMISAHEIRGQYCLVEGAYSFLDQGYARDDTETVVEWPGDELSAWSALRMFTVNPVKLNRQKLYWALCIPSSCTNADVETSLTKILGPIFSKYRINMTINVEKTYCQVHQTNPNYPSGYFNARIIFRTIFCIVVMATIYDIVLRRGDDSSQTNSTFIQMLRGFSIVCNTRKLVEYSPQTEVVSAHFVKIIIMLFCIYGHRFMYLLSFPSFDTERIEMNLKNWRSIKITHIALVDVFFMYSGYLIYQLNASKLKKRGVSEVLIIILNRWFRLIPTYGFLMLFIAYILPYSSDGPLWQNIHTEAEYCRTNWLVGVLAVNNVFDSEKLCFWVSWFVSVDFQLTIIGSILLLIMARNEKLGLYLCGIIYSASTVIIFLTVYKGKILGLLPQYLGTAVEFRMKREFTEVYVSLSLHVAPYLMGFLSPLIIQKLKNRKYEFSSLQTIGLAIITIIVGETFNIYGSVFYDFDKKYNALENALYVSFRRTFFMLPFLVLHILKMTSGLGFLMDNLVEQSIYVPLGRLSYSAFLTNTILHMYHVYSQRNILPSSLAINQFWWFTTDVVYTYFTGFLLYLFVEAPFGNIAKMILKHVFR